MRAVADGHRTGRCGRKAVQPNGFGFDDLSLIEINEAFAVQVLAVLSGWGVKLADVDDRLNVNGSGISLGHPDRGDRRADPGHDAARIAPRGGAWRWRPCASAAGRASPHLPGSADAGTVGLIAYASYLPRYRLAGGDVGVRRGDRVVASYDEDSTTMAVAASAERYAGTRRRRNLYFATSSPAYADKTNATADPFRARVAVDAAFAVDLVRHRDAAVAAMAAAAATGGLAVSADVRVGRPGIRRRDDSVVTARRRCYSVGARRSPTSCEHVADGRVPRSLAIARVRSPASSGRSASARSATRR
jgi:hypothetical protein